MRVNDRWRGGKGYKTNKIFGCAIKKYGWDAFEHIVLYENVSEQFAIEKEIELISEWHTTDNHFGYNRDPGGFIHSEATRRKIGSAHAGDKNYWRQHQHTEEYCKAMSESLKDRVFTEEHKRHLSEAQTGEKNHMYGIKWSEDRRGERSQMYQGAANPNYGNKWTAEQKAAQSERLKARKKTG